MQTLPYSLANLDPITWDGFATHFARFRDVQEEVLEGAGCRSAPDPEAAQLEEERATALFPLLDDLPDYGVPSSFDVDEDRSGAFLVRQSAGADRLCAGHARATIGSFDVALPVPLAEWQRIWTPMV